jgi:hypothetical protein
MAPVACTADRPGSSKFLMTRAYSFIGAVTSGPGEAHPVRARPDNAGRTTPAGQR